MDTVRAGNDPGLEVKRTKAWWNGPEFKQNELMNEEEEKTDMEKWLESPKGKAINEIAAQYVDRKWYDKSISGEIPEGMTKEKFSESIWEEALEDGQRRYEALHEDENSVLFENQMKLKEAVVEKRAMDEMAKLIGQEKVDVLKIAQEKSKEDKKKRDENDGVKRF